MQRDDLLISTAELAALAGRPDVRAVDLRWSLDNPDAGEREHELAHIPGALYLHWYRDLSDPDDPILGQIAPPERFREAMERAGIGDETLVVGYDDNVIFMAARLAWCLHFYGHDRVRWLEGGLPKWAAEGRPLESGRLEHPGGASFTPRPRPGLRRTKEDVLALVQDGGPLLLDCRMDRTWIETGAHIPGARRLPAPSLLREDGTLRDGDEISALARTAGARPDEPVVLYCGGGVSASAAYLALRSAGFERASVYDGSWSEWSADPETPKEAH